MTDDKKADTKSEEKVNLNDTGPADVTVDVPHGEFDDSTVKFLKNGGADANVAIVSPKEDKDEFAGLTKEELMQYAKDPFWVRMRIALLVLFWLAWFGMLAAAIAIIILAPRCPPRPNLQWWQKGSTYQCYPRSFKDTDGNGKGDLKGVENNLDYLDNLNITAVYMNSFYSPSDYKTVDPSFGTIEDFRSLKRAMHRRSIKFIMDFVPNHASINHTWFQESRKGPSNKYSDYFVWVNGTKGTPPNNWMSVHGGSAWEYDDERKAFYLHQFLVDQPDLNIRNPQVQQELKDIFKFWLEEGVDGFRLGAVPYLFESNNTAQDEPQSGLSTDTKEYDYLDHVYTVNQPETYQIVTDWRALLDEYSSSEDRKYEYRVLMTEVTGDSNATMLYYKYNDRNGADVPLNPSLLKLDKDCGGSCVHKLVDSFVTNMPAGKWANWMLSNSDSKRVASRVGDNKVNAANMLSLLLPGTSVSYYGEEIGMTDVANITWEATQDPVAKKAGKDKYKAVSRDPARTPMQWSGGANAGFTNPAVKPWLPLSPDYVTRNVEVQNARGAGHTNIEIFNELTTLRFKPSFQWGTLNYVYVDDNMFSFVRQAQGFTGFLVAINFGKSEQIANFYTHKKELLGQKGVIVANTDKEKLTDFKLNQEVSLDGILLKPGEGVVFGFPWEDRFKTDK